MEKHVKPLTTDCSLDDALGTLRPETKVNRDRITANVNKRSLKLDKPQENPVKPTAHGKLPTSDCRASENSPGPMKSPGISAQAQQTDIALWRLPKVLAHIPVSRSHWLAGVAEGRYPAPVKLSKRCVAWRSADILALIASF